MAPILIAVSDAARVLGLSASTISALAANGEIPSLRVGRRVLLPVKALEDWIEGRLAQDAEQSRAPWAAVRGFAPPPVQGRKGRGFNGRRPW